MQATSSFINIIYNNNITIKLQQQHNNNNNNNKYNNSNKNIINNSSNSTRIVTTKIKAAITIQPVEFWEKKSVPKNVFIESIDLLALSKSAIIRLFWCLLFAGNAQL